MDSYPLRVKYRQLWKFVVANGNSKCFHFESLKIISFPNFVEKYCLSHWVKNTLKNEQNKLFTDQFYKEWFEINEKFPMIAAIYSRIKKFLRFRSFLLKRLRSFGRLGSGYNNCYSIQHSKYKSSSNNYTTDDYWRKSILNELIIVNFCADIKHYCCFFFFI